jgi:Regulator of chromosome condensation (RCC1) repeat
MKKRFHSLKSILTVTAITFFVVFFIIASQTAAKAAQPMVAAGDKHTVGLKSDGSVVAVGWNEDGQLNVGSYTDIVQVAAGVYTTVGLKSNGTVVAVGANESGQLNVGSWTNIVQVDGGGGFTVGLKSDGTVVAVGFNFYGQCNVGSWTNIVQVASGSRHTAGLKSDGTVVVVGDNSYGQCNVGSWTGIVQVSAGSTSLITVGLKTDGTVVAVGHNEYGQLNVGSWTDIVQVDGGGYHIVGLKSDGTAVAVGAVGLNCGQLNVGSWTNIVQVAGGGLFTVGLKSNGTVVAVGYNTTGQCNVSGWNLGSPSSLFIDVPNGYWAETAIYKIYNAGITKGCSQIPLMYCPEGTVTRTQMAVFLGRAIHGSSFTPPSATGIFSDVPVSYWAVDWIEQFYNDGITTGCGTNPLRYCPDNNVTRAQMAIFLLRSKHGSSYTPPAASGIFSDVPVTYWAADWIEQLYHEGITTGCGTGPLRYCPGNSVTRAQMAVFIMRTFGL